MNELQRTPEWFEQKLGRLSGSRVHEIIPLKRGSYPASREALLYELLSERITGQRAEKYVTPSMAWGTEMEPIAIERYVAQTGRSVGTIGFVHHPSIPKFGASPDGVVGSDGVIECKCPGTSKVLKILSGEDIDPSWAFQMQTEMIVTRRDWCDFVLYDPRLPAPLDLTIRRIHKDKLVCELIEAEAKKFNAELDEKELTIRERMSRF